MTRHVTNTGPTAERLVQVNVSASRSMRMGKSMTGTIRTSATSWIVNTSPPV
jgi:hypothetical protein